MVAVVAAVAPSREQNEQRKIPIYPISLACDYRTGRSEKLARKKRLGTATNARIASQPPDPAGTQPVRRGNRCGRL